MFFNQDAELPIDDLQPHCQGIFAVGEDGSIIQVNQPVSLLEELAGIAVYPPAKSWAQRVQQQLGQLQAYQSLTDPSTRQTLQQLSALVKSGNKKAEATNKNKIPRTASTIEGSLVVFIFSPI